PQSQGHDIVVRNIWSNDAFILRGSHVAIMKSTFDVGDAGRPTSGTSHINGCKGNTFTVPTTYALIDGVTIENLLQTHQANAQGCQSWQCQHDAPIHFEGGQHVVIQNPFFLNNTQHNIEAEPEDGAEAFDWLIQNNVFDYLCSHQQNSNNGGYCAAAGSGLPI